MRTLKQHEAAAGKFIGNINKQWDSLAEYLKDAVQYYWKNGRDGKPTCQNEAIVVWQKAIHASGHKNMYKALKAFIADTTPVILKDNPDHEKNGGSNKKKLKDMKTAFETTANKIEALEDGDSLKAYLEATGQAPKKRGPVTISDRVSTLLKKIEAEDCSMDELFAASALLDQLHNTVLERLGLTNAKKVKKVAKAA